MQELDVAITLSSPGRSSLERRRSKSELTQLLAGDQEGYSIKVFTIAYGTGSDVDTVLMADIADASGARTYQSGPTEIEQVYRDIATFF